MRKSIEVAVSFAVGTLSLSPLFLFSKEQASLIIERNKKVGSE